MRLGAIIRKELVQLFFVVLSFVLMVAVSYYFVRDIVEKQIFVAAQETINTAEVAIRSDLRDAEASLLQVEMLIENWLKWGASNAEIRAYMTELAGTMSSDNAWISGILNIYGIVNGELISGLYAASEGYVPEERPWFYTAEEAKGQIGITSPYIDNKIGIPVVSFAKIMYNANGERFGTIALDIDFSNLSDYIESLHFTQANDKWDAAGGFGLLLDENFFIIAHPSIEYINRPVVEIDPEYAKMVRGIKEKPGLISTMQMTNTEGIPLVLISKELFNGWYLGIATPVASYYSDVKSMAVTLSALGIIFMIVLCFILVQLSVSKAHSDEVNMEKSSFLARMSHEIRTPMNSILGMAELIQRKEVSGEVQEYIEIIQQSGNNLLSIINDILDFSKIESGRLQIQNRNYNIASVINDMVNMFRPRIAEKSLDLFVNVDSSIPARLFGDDMRLRQILTNLFSNAVKYTRKGFISLDVGIERVDGDAIRLIFSVHDSGVGIRSEDQQHIFKEFFRMDTKSNRGIEGTGLGLAITKALARAMGGDVAFFSEYGKGSVFRAVVTQTFEDDKPVGQVINPERKRVLFYDWRPRYVESILSTFNSLGITYKRSLSFQDFISDLEHGQYEYAFISSKYAMDCIYTLGKENSSMQLVIMVEPGEISVYREVISIPMPLYSITVANALNDVSDGFVSQSSKLRIQFTAPGAKILIVDDISTNLRVAKELMAPYGMDVQTCLSGPEAIELVKDNRYDIVFMDHMMPGMDGLEATAQIRSLESEDDYYLNLPIVALTANAIYGQREIFLEHGINDFLAKPIDIQKLNDILERWLPWEKLKESARTQQVDVKPEKPEALDIPELDVARGLLNCGGNTQVYESILADFCQDAETRVLQIAEALDQGDTKRYTTMVHAVKGAARSIGAMETGEKASVLEKAADDGNLAAIKEKTTVFFDDVRTLINNIKSALDRQEAEDRVEPTDPSTLQLETLKTALAEMDIEAVNKILLEYAALSLDSKTKALIYEVEQHILMFEYDKAIEKINEKL